MERIVEKKRGREGFELILGPGAINGWRGKEFPSDQKELELEIARIFCSAIDDDLAIARNRGFDVRLERPSRNEQRRRNAPQVPFVRLAAVQEHGVGVGLAQAHRVLRGHLSDAGPGLGKEVARRLVGHEGSLVGCVVRCRREVRPCRVGARDLASAGLADAKGAPPVRHGRPVATAGWSRLPRSVGSLGACRSPRKSSSRSRWAWESGSSSRRLRRPRSTPSSSG